MPTQIQNQDTSSISKDYILNRYSRAPASITPQQAKQDSLDAAGLRNKQILTQTQKGGTLEGLTGLTGEIENYMEPGALMGEFEELFAGPGAVNRTQEALPTILGEGLDPWDWSGSGWWGENNMGNLNKGFNRGYRVAAARERGGEAKLRSGYQNHVERIKAIRGGDNKIDNYFYNLALTEVYQKASNSITATRDINPAYLDHLQFKEGGGGLTGWGIRQTDEEEIERLGNLEQGFAKGHIFKGSPSNQKTWERYEGIVQEYAPETIKDLQAKASAIAFEKSNEYRNFVRGELSSTVSAIKNAKDVEDKGDLIISLNRMLETTKDIDTYDESRRRLAFVSEQSTTLDADKILDTFETLDNSNFEYDKDMVAKAYNNPSSREIVQTFSTAAQNLEKDKKNKKP